MLVKGIKKEQFSLTIEEIERMKGYKDGVSPYNEVDDAIDSIDEGDGGYEATMVIERISDEKFFACNYTGWQLDHNDDESFDFTEVDKKIKTITYYE